MRVMQNTGAKNESDDESFHGLRIYGVRLVPKIEPFKIIGALVKRRVLSLKFS